MTSALRSRLFRFFLWWAVIGFSIWFGGTVFSMTVIVPMWSDGLPESARSFFSGTSFSRHIYNFFGPPWMVLRNAPLLLALALGANSRPHRRYLLIASVILVSAIAVTIGVIYPINDALMLKAGKDLPDAELIRLARTWITYDRIRFAFMAVAFICLLMAFRLPYRPER